VYHHPPAAGDEGRGEVTREGRARVVSQNDRIRVFATQHEEKLRFLVVGGWNTLFSLVSLWLLDHYVPYDPSSLIQKEAVLALNWVICVTHNFFTFKLLVFRTKGNWLREYLRMYVTYSATFLIQSGMILALSTWFGWSLFWANVPTLIIVTIMSYLGHKFFTFRTQEEAVEAALTEQDESDGVVPDGE
jgi:putative flippase GtrA